MQRSQAAPPLQCFSFSMSAAQALRGFMFLALSPHSIFIFNDVTDSISRTVLEDSFCIFGGML